MSPGSDHVSEFVNGMPLRAPRTPTKTPAPAAKTPVTAQPPPKPSPIAPRRQRRQSVRRRAASLNYGAGNRRLFATLNRHRFSHFHSAPEGDLLKIMRAVRRFTSDAEACGKRITALAAIRPMALQFSLNYPRGPTDHVKNAISMADCITDLVEAEKRKLATLADNMMAYQILDHGVEEEDDEEDVCKENPDGVCINHDPIAKSLDEVGDRGTYRGQVHSHFCPLYFEKTDDLGDLCLRRPIVAMYNKYWRLPEKLSFFQVMYDHFLAGRRFCYGDVMRN